MKFRLDVVRGLEWKRPRVLQCVPHESSICSRVTELRVSGLMALSRRWADEEGRRPSCGEMRSSEFNEQSEQCPWGKNGKVEWKVMESPICRVGIELFAPPSPHATNTIRSAARLGRESDGFGLDGDTEFSRGSDRGSGGVRANSHFGFLPRNRPISSSLTAASLYAKNDQMKTNRHECRASATG